MKGKFNLGDISPTLPIQYNRDKTLERMLGGVREERAAKETQELAYKQETLEVLKRIDDNTKGLDSVVDLLMNLSKQQDEVLELLQEILAISASNTIEDAEGRYRRIMDKVATGIEDVTTVQTLIGFAGTIFQMYIKMKGG